MKTNATPRSLAESGSLLAGEDPGLLMSGNGEQEMIDLAETLDTAAALVAPMGNDEAWRVSAAEHKAGRPRWREVTESTYYSLLGDMPPHMYGHAEDGTPAFLAGEPHHFDLHGDQVYLAARLLSGDRFEVKMTTERDFRSEFPRRK